jgi:DNA-damage-inducible protein J
MPKLPAEVCRPSRRSSLIYFEHWHWPRGYANRCRIRSPSTLILAFVIHLHYTKGVIRKLWPMPATALIQARIDPAIRDRAAEVLDRMGMTVSDAVRILLTRVANEGALPAGLTVDPVAHDTWFRAKVMEALDSRQPQVPHDEVEQRFATRRAAAQAKGAGRQE